MASTRAATPAGRRGATARKGRSSARPAPKKPRKQPAGRKPAGRSGRRAAAPARTTAKRPTARKPGARGKPATRKKPAARKKPATAAARRPGTRGGLSWRARLLVAGAVALALGAGYLFWLKDSSLVAVTDVEVVGVRSGDRELIVDALRRSGERMSTLDVDEGALEQVAGRFPTIASLSADANIPHGLRIEVVERPPALLAVSGREELAVAADGSVLAGVEAAEELPKVEVEALPSAGRLEGDALSQALVIGAAPSQLAPLIESAKVSKPFGVEIELRGEIPVRFGDSLRAGEKWAAVAAVLADPKLETLSFLDVRVPERPAAGGQPEPQV